jgi:4-amino-4-deoxy-L-arabinose transferase-like glycosyltransferase
MLIYLCSLVFGILLVLIWLRIVDSPATFPHWTGAIPVIAGMVGSDLLQRWRRRSRGSAGR